jgi:hypothetical protein
MKVQNRAVEDIAMCPESEHQAVGGKELRSAILRLNTRVPGLSFVMVFGIGLFLLTNWLVIKGGPNVGAHLILLRQYFPGYSVTFWGSIVAFAYAFILGYAVGVLISELYNKFADV